MSSVQPNTFDILYQLSQEYEAAKETAQAKGGKEKTGKIYIRTLVDKTTGQEQLKATFEGGGILRRILNWVSRAVESKKYVLKSGKDSEYSSTAALLKNLHSCTSTSLLEEAKESTVFKKMSPTDQGRAIEGIKVACSKLNEILIGIENKKKEEIHILFTEIMLPNLSDLKMPATPPQPKKSPVAEEPKKPIGEEKPKHSPKPSPKISPAAAKIPVAQVAEPELPLVDAKQAFLKLKNTDIPNAEKMISRNNDEFDSAEDIQSRIGEIEKKKNQIQTKFNKIATDYRRAAEKSGKKVEFEVYEKEYKEVKEVCDKFLKLADEINKSLRALLIT